MYARGYDWNGAAGSRRASLHDETLRDGAQSPSAIDPPIDAKIEIVHLLDAVGVASVNVGLPGAGPRAYRDSLALCREIARAGLRIRPGCAARTLAADVTPIVEISQQTGIAVEALLFIGSSPIRRLVECWSIESIRQRTEQAVRTAVGAGLPVTYVTEDTTRTPPPTLRELFAAALGSGASGICLCDTVGHATPDGVRNLVGFARDVVRGLGADARLDWHGHDDRGLALANALAALDAGVDRLHGCVLGIGERVGNSPLEMLLVHLEARGLIGRLDRGRLVRLCELVSRTTHLRPRPGHLLIDPDQEERRAGRAALPHRGEPP